ncbi:helix-turn-helix transcriptional regulator [Salinibacterium sp. M195]|uniref:helix-turn-helix domain-containing protein n=1 Tax=Salinibacterium sp. M195 TaxID=2583374 RepID=UPI001C631409|nr:helix-turn-helix transcriptional regulator [Salinibacterium sp. M195]QYH36845.1 helix-turn-helix domain-containing protein [Salinibacterium sp. M195]
MTSTIKSTRRAAGITVKELALRLDVSPSAVSQLERSEAEGTIKLNSLREALEALGASLRITAGAAGPMSRYAPYRVADSLSESLLRDSDPTFRLRLLTHAVKELAENSAAFDRADVETAPTALPDKRWDTLMRAAYARVIPESERPDWTRTSKLSEPWFLSEFPLLRERAKTTTPDYLRELNIFIDERSLTRA